MTFQRSIREIIQARCSWRTYDGRPLAEDVAVALRAAVQAPPVGPFGNEVTLALLEPFGAGQEQPQKLGTYGVIRGARQFLAGMVCQGAHDMEDYGYVFEWAILQATDLGLGTCWLGGTLQRDAFGRALGAGGDQVVPAVSPVGYARQKRGLVDSLFRWVAGSKDRKPWSELFFDGNFATPLRSEAAGVFAEVLEMVRLGPSASNRQPWRILREADRERWHLFLQRTPGYGKMTAVDLQRIDLGIAMAHVALTAHELELAGDWQVLAHTDLPYPLDQQGTLPPNTEYIVSWCGA